MRELRKCISCQQFTLIPNNKVSDKTSTRLKELNVLLDESGKLREQWSHKFKEGIKLSKSECDGEIAHLQMFNERNSLQNEIVGMLEQDLYRKCRFCGERLFIDIMSEDDVIQYGYKAYNEYIDFMKIERAQMPKEIIIRVGEFGDPNGRCSYDEKLKMFVITIRKGEDFYRHNLPPIFYHEFTHIFDLYDPLTGGQKAKDEQLHYYIEYSASEIEIKKLLGFKSVDDNKKFRLIM